MGSLVDADRVRMIGPRPCLATLSCKPRVIAIWPLWVALPDVGSPPHNLRLAVYHSR